MGHEKKTKKKHFKLPSQIGFRSAGYLDGGRYDDDGDDDDDSDDDDDDDDDDGKGNDKKKFGPGTQKKNRLRKPQVNSSFNFSVSSLFHFFFAKFVLLPKSVSWISSFSSFLPLVSTFCC